MNVQARSVQNIINICVERKKKIVAGGPLFTHEYEKFFGVTHFILNEAELTLPEFIADLKNNSPKHIYKSENFADIHVTPAPMWELVDLNKYLYSIVQYSRGCPYLCDFCDVTALFGRVPRTKTSNQIVSELDALLKLGKNEMIFFADDNLIGNKKLLKQDLLPVLIEWRSKNINAPTFATQLTINLADDPELMKMLLEAGFRHILIGIESLQTNSLEQMKKKQNVMRNLLENVRMLQSKGFIVIGTFIVGLDSDTEDVFQNLIDFIQESGLVLVVVNVLKAPPGTELHERMKKENRLVESFEFNEDKTNIIPLMDKNKLHQGYKLVLKNVYDPKNVLQRIISFYSNLKPERVKNSIRRKITLREVFVFAGIIFHLGFIFPKRIYFWQLVFWTIKNKPGYSDLSLLFGLLMFQYQKLYSAFVKKEEDGNYIYTE